MRKRYKKKKRSCAMCKPWKMCHEHRWKADEMIRLREWERERKQLLG